MQRAFRAAEPNRLWVAGITYIPTLAGFLFLAVVLDVFSRKVVGWAMATHLRTELVLDALEMAIFRRRPTDVVHHSDSESLRAGSSALSKMLRRRHASCTGGAWEGDLRCLERAASWKSTS